MIDPGDRPEGDYILIDAYYKGMEQSVKTATPAQLKQNPHVVNLLTLLKEFERGYDTSVSDYLFDIKKALKEFERAK